MLLGYGTTKIKDSFEFEEFYPSSISSRSWNGKILPIDFCLTMGEFLELQRYIKRKKWIRY